MRRKVLNLSPGIQNRMTKWTWLLFFLWGVSSCRTPEGETTGDEARSGAVEIRPGVLQDDQVSARGDPVDFKRFHVGQVTPCIINVYWDNPQIVARLVLRDMFGGVVSEVSHAKGAGKDTIGPVTLKDGTFFLEVEARSGTSVYTVELFLGDPESVGSEAIPWPE